jgi:hypothetical protein
MVKPVRALTSPVSVRAGAWGVRIGESGGEGGRGFFGIAALLLLGEATQSLVGAYFPVLRRFLVLLLRHPAAGRHVLGAGGFGNAKQLALPLIQIFAEGPGGLEGAVGAGIFFVRAEGESVGMDGDFGNGLLRDGFGVGRLGGADGAWKAEGGDLAGIENFAGAGGVEGVGE